MGKWNDPIEVCRMVGHSFVCMIVLGGALFSNSSAQLVLPSPLVNRTEVSGLINTGEALYFVADDGLTGAELWRCDRDNSISMVSDLLAGPQGSHPTYLTETNGKIYFFATWISGGLPKRQLVVTEGADDTTRILSRWNINMEVYSAVSRGDEFFFTIRHKELITELWHCDPKINDGRPYPLNAENGYPIGLIDEGGVFEFNDTIIFLARDFKREDGLFYLYAIDEHSRTPHQLTLEDGTPISGYGSMEAVSDEESMFFALHHESGIVWRLDKGDSFIKCIVEKQSGDGKASELTLHDTGLVFNLNDSVHGNELWHYDYERKEAHMLVDVYPGQMGSSPYAIVATAQGIAFAATGEKSGTELYYYNLQDKSLHTFDLEQGPKSSNPYSMILYGEDILFSYSGSDIGEEIFLLNTKTLEVDVLLDINEGTNSSEPYNMTKFNNGIYFTAVNKSGSSELWRTEATAVTTLKASEFHSAPVSRPSNPELITSIGKYVYFLSTSQETGRELWRTDGEKAHTECLSDLDLHKSKMKTIDFVVVDERLYLNAHDLDNQELWISYDTRTNTLLTYLENPLPTTPKVSPAHITMLGGHTLFSNWDIHTGQELWVRDGASSPPKIVKDIIPGMASSSPRQFTLYKGKGYFVAYGPTGMQELWVTDGSAYGTIRVYSIGRENVEIGLCDNGIVVLYRYQSNNVLTLYNPAYIEAHLSSRWQDAHANMESMIPLGNSVFAVMDHPRYGQELWVRSLEPLDRFRLLTK